MKKLLLLLAVGIISFSCNNSSSKSSGTAQTKDQNKVEISNDMENALSLVPSWVNEKTIVKMEGGKAHSGEYVSKVDDVDIYSYAYREYLLNISDKLPKRVFVNGWVNSPVPNEKMGIILDITENNTMNYWKAFNLKSVVVEPNKWYEFTAGFLIDEPIK